jgi:hypothetical protein
MLTAIAPARALHAQSEAPGLHLALLPVQMTRLPPATWTSCRMYSIVSPTFPPAPSQFCALDHKQRTAVHRALTTYLTFKLDADTDSLPCLDTWCSVGLAAVPHPDPPAGASGPDAAFLPSFYHPVSRAFKAATGMRPKSEFPRRSQRPGTASPIDFIFIFVTPASSASS